MRPIPNSTARAAIRYFRAGYKLATIRESLSLTPDELRKIVREHGMGRPKKRKSRKSKVRTARKQATDSLHCLRMAAQQHLEAGDPIHVVIAVYGKDVVDSLRTAQHDADADGAA